jgi:hypothetical protein
MASAACRSRIASPDRRPRDLAPVPAIPAAPSSALLSPDLVSSNPEEPLTAGQVCRDLEELSAAGFIEAFRDEYNIVRYRPANGRLA